MAAYLLPRATLAQNYPLVHPHGVKSHTQRLIVRCGAGAADDGWGALMDELKSALQSDPSAPVPADGGAAAVPDGLVTALPLDPSSVPAVGDTTNATAAAAAETAASSSAVDVVSGGDAASGAIPDGLLSTLHLDASNPAVRAAGGALSRLDALTSGLSDAQRWALAGFLALTWAYLTARPGVLIGAVDAYMQNPQLGQPKDLKCVCVLREAVVKSVNSERQLT
ncbi:hypothetical protein EJB05_36165, partial [Eragrostis curvula]